MSRAMVSDDRPEGLRGVVARGARARGGGICESFERCEYPDVPEAVLAGGRPGPVERGGRLAESASSSSEIVSTNKSSYSWSTPDIVSDKTEKWVRVRGKKKGENGEENTRWKGENQQVMCIGCGATRSSHSILGLLSAARSADHQLALTAHPLNIHYHNYASLSKVPLSMLYLQFKEASGQKDHTGSS